MVIQKQIMEAKTLCLEAGRIPIAVLMNQKTFDELEAERKQHVGSRGYEVCTIFGMPIKIFPEIVDFFIVDKRSWAEQKV